jgi:secreted trypsin-like serine protease
MEVMKEPLLDGNNERSSHTITANKKINFRGATENHRHGHSDVPHEVSLKVKPLDVCYETAGIRDIISNRDLCVGGDGYGACIGDSGGGLFAARGSKFFLRGITSASLFNPELRCDVNNPTIFTNVEKFSSWIQSKLGAYF